MCTSISMNDGSFCFGRNMDIEFTLEAQVTAAPRRYPFSFRSGISVSPHLAVIGMAVVRSAHDVQQSRTEAVVRSAHDVQQSRTQAVVRSAHDVQQSRTKAVVRSAHDVQQSRTKADRGCFPLYADAMNEHGLCMAGLSFPECVYAQRAAEGCTGIAPFELIPWVLGSCRDISEARALLRTTTVVDVPFSADIPNTPLHWHIADASGSLVVECTADGMQLHDDPVGILTNSPPLPFHLTNLRQYANLTARYPSEAPEELAPFGRGFGAVGLPGDFSPASRFVRAAFLRLNSPRATDVQRQSAQLLRILANVAMPRGSVFTKDGRAEYTAYSCCMSGGSYRFAGSLDFAARGFSLQDCDLNGSELCLLSEPENF